MTLQEALRLCPIGTEIELVHNGDRYKIYEIIEEQLFTFSGRGHTRLKFYVMENRLGWVYEGQFKVVKRANSKLISRKGSL